MISTLDHDPVFTSDPATTSPSCIVFDIETGPAPADELARHLPEIEAPANYKDTAKIEAYKQEQREKFLHRAPLSALTGRVLAIGLWADGEYHAHICGDHGDAEAACIRWFWNHVGRQTILVGFNSNRFDLPFLYRRSWALGIPVPPQRVQPNGRLNDRLHHDLMEMWQLGDRQNFISLDAVSKYLGTGGKSGEGDLFHQILRAFPDEAEAYLKNDVRLTFELAKRMHLLHPEIEFEEK